MNPEGIQIAGLANKDNSGEGTTESSGNSSSFSNGMVDLDLMLFERPTKEEVSLAESETELQEELVKIYVAYTKQLLSLQEQHRRHTARVGEVLIYIMHALKPLPTSKGDLDSYKRKRTEYLASRVRVDKGKEQATLAPLKAYLKKRNVYDHIDLDL